MNLPKSHLFKVKYLGPTNYRGSRVVISSEDSRHRNNGKPHKITLNFDYSIGRTDEIALNALKKAGFKVICLCETKNNYYITAKWDFEKLSTFFKVRSYDNN